LKEVVGSITVEDVAKKGLITGAWAGGLLGLLTGAAFLWIPGFGPLIVASLYRRECYPRRFMQSLLRVLSWKSFCLL
jgi:hypothetical protein